MADELAEIDGRKPKVLLRDGESREAKSSGSYTYKVKRTQNQYYCHCPGWRNQTGVPVNARTCKHLREILGDEYETARLKLKNPKGHASLTSKPSPSKGKRKRDDDEDEDDSEFGNDDDNDDEEDDERPQKKRKPASKVKAPTSKGKGKKKSDSDEDESESDAPRRKKAAKPISKGKGKAAPKKRASKKEDSEDGEDLSDEINAVSGSDADESEDEKPKKKAKTKAPPKKQPAKKKKDDFDEEEDDDEEAEAGKKRKKPASTSKSVWPPVKKARHKKALANSDDDEDESPKKPKPKGKNDKLFLSDSEATEDDSEAEPVSKKKPVSKGDGKPASKAKGKKKQESDEDEDEVEEDVKPPKKSAAKPASKAKGKKTQESEDEDEDDEDVKPPKKNAAKPASHAKGKKKQDSDDDEDVKPPKKSAAKPASKAKGKKKQDSDDEDDAEEDDEDDAQPSADPSNSSDPLAKIDGHKPKVYLADGEEREVKSMSSNSTYTIKRTWDHYYCKCPAWRNQAGAPTNARTCKHLRQLLGDAYENARLKWQNPNGPPPKPASKAKPKSKGKKKAGDDDDDDDDDDSGGKKVPELLLANKWDIDTGPDPTGWWISEKLDGVRTFYDGKGMVSRLGNPFTPPQWFLDKLPTDCTLDGELFAGRGKFQDTVSIVKTQNSPHWKEITFQIFDVPSENTPFEDRVAFLKKLFGPGGKYECPEVVLVEHEKAKDRPHVLDKLKEVEELGGEGLMLRKPKSKYEGRRSGTLLKIKTFYDAEAEVTGYTPGKGKHAGLTGALKCKMQSGKTFNVGTGLSDKQRKNPPKIGTIITYRFQELTRDGVPRFPSYIGEAIDKKKAKDAKLPAHRKAGGNKDD